jgi:glucose/mannose-6-phosphate isomerase
MSARDPMRGLVAAFPEMLEEALAVPVPDRFRLEGGRVILLGGMGGSGMAASLGSHLLQEAGRPSVSWRNARFPEWVGAEDRIVLVSYSGFTWEAVSMFEDALLRSAPLRAVTSGGTLAKRCEEEDVPCFRVPPGMPPRASLPWLCVGAARATGCVTDEQIEGAVGLLRRERDAPTAGRDPVRIARLLKDRCVVFVPIGPTMEMVAYRWRNQILENAEQACVVSPAPEMAHNEIMGWPWLKEARIPVTFLGLVERRPLDEKWECFLSGLDAEATCLGHKLEVLEPRGNETFDSILASIHLADRVSVELASLRGVAATPVAAIGRLKAAMERKES